MSLLVHEELCNCTVPGAILASSASTHAGFCWLSSQSASFVALCLKSGYFAFPFSNLLSHHCEGSEKNSCQSFSLLLPFFLLAYIQTDLLFLLQLVDHLDCKKKKKKKKKLWICATDQNSIELRSDARFRGRFFSA
jgi:penicillin-binding protein-related factor A (putative recombinase)